MMQILSRRKRGSSRLTSGEKHVNMNIYIYIDVFRFNSSGLAADLVLMAWEAVIV